MFVVDLFIILLIYFRFKFYIKIADMSDFPVENKATV